MDPIFSLLQNKANDIIEVLKHICNKVDWLMKINFFL